MPVFTEAKDDGGGADNWTTGAISRAKLQSNHNHQQTNVQFFTGRMPFLSPNQQCQSTEGKKLNDHIVRKILGLIWDYTENWDFRFDHNLNLYLKIN